MGQYSEDSGFSTGQLPCRADIFGSVMSFVGYKYSTKEARARAVAAMEGPDSSLDGFDSAIE